MLIMVSVVTRRVPVGMESEKKYREIPCKKAKRARGSRKAPPTHTLDAIATSVWSPKEINAILVFDPRNDVLLQCVHAVAFPPKTNEKMKI